jgi:hypothetical protein
MALLQRVRILPNERLDLPDFKRIEDFVCADLKQILKKTQASANFVVEGFLATGIGTNTLSVAVADAACLVGADDGALFVGAPSLAALQTTSLSPGTTNYVEITLDQDTGGADSRAFWDPTAAGGAGAEFSQIVDTFTYLKAELSISTSNFSGDPDKVKVCEVDVNGSGVITAIRDSRDLLYRLGSGSNPLSGYSWSSRTEPANTQFSGADKDIKNQRQMNAALMDSIREIKGTAYWFELAPVTLSGIFQNVGLSVITAATSSARFSWSGTQLSISDDSGTPLDSDVLAYIRLFNSTNVLSLTRQQAAGAITIPADNVLWVELPDPLANVTYDSVGVTSLNYRITPRGSVPNNDNVYWLAFRDAGSRIYVRGLGELEAGESHQISDEMTEVLREFLGFDPETATSVPYTSVPSVLLPSTFTISDSLVTAISAISDDLNYLAAILAGNVYDERLLVVSGAPANDNEVTGPITAGTNISLPLDSRDSNTTQVYIVGRGDLEVFLNGVYLFEGIDWTPVGLSGASSSTIQIQVDLEVDDELTFRLDTAGGFASGSGSGSLQDAYNIGRTITVTAGNPVEISGPSGKLLKVNGDMDVSGVIDPKGITFTRESSDPLPAQDGLYVNAAGDLMYKKNGSSITNVSTAISGGGSSAANALTLENQSGGNLPKLTPVRIDSNGFLDTVDVAVEADCIGTVGVVTDGIANAAQGSVTVSGIVLNVSGFNNGDVLYVDKAGNLTATKPSIGVNSFVAGDFVIRIGVVSRDPAVPTQKNLIVNVQVVGQL